MSYFNVEVVRKPSVKDSPVISVKFEGLVARDRSDAGVRALAQLADDKRYWQVITIKEAA